MNAKAEGKCEACGGVGEYLDKTLIVHAWRNCSACSGTGRAPQQTAAKGVDADIEAWADSEDELLDLDREELRKAVREARYALAQRDAEVANLRTDIKAAFHELGGIGHESSKEFHRIGIDSARGILNRALGRK